MKTAVAKLIAEGFAVVLERVDQVFETTQGTAFLRQVIDLDSLEALPSALLLAKVGLLNGRRATTHWAGLELLASLDPTIQIQRDTRVVSDGVVTSAGVSAGLDMSFSVVENICGRAVAEETAHYIEYVPKYQNAV